MSMTPAASNVAHADVAILGGGVAGLWLLARLRRQGYNAMLFESNALGAGQTLYAQGIIHGGTKYALTGKLSDSTKAVSEMPGRWRDCLQGKGELDLSNVKILSPYQYLWSTSSLTSKVAGFFASRVMSSRTSEIKGNARPLVFQHPEFKGQVYRLDEPIIDTSSLVQALQQLNKEAIYQLGDDIAITVGENGKPVITSNQQNNKVIEAETLVLTAGKGNTELLSRLGRDKPDMQLRPLRMIMLRGNLPEMLYAHCLGPSANPRITITSHYDQQGEVVWYVGGQLAEDGVARSDAEQIAAAKTEMADLFPWLDFAAIQWSALYIERAEIKQPGGKRPDGVYVNYDDKVITAWPTKLALAPKLADDVIDLLEKNNILPSGITSLPQWQGPDCAKLPWQQESLWNTGN